MEDNQNNQDEQPVDRNDRAKAFFRAMYAGGEPDPDQFGIDVGQKQAQSDSVSQAAIAHLEGQLKEAEQRATDAESLYKRMAADFDNFRKRMEREREEFQSIGMQKAFEAILPALDDLDMASSRLNENTDSKVMFDSMKMVFTRLSRCLEQIGIKKMVVVGQPFDPRVHEPVQEIATREVEPGAVVHELRAGWNFKEKTLRPALVNVATAPSEDEAAAPASEASSETPGQENTAEAVSTVSAETTVPDFDKARPTAQEVVSNGAGVETCDTLDALDSPGTMRSTQDLPIEEIKAAIAEAEEREKAESAESEEESPESGKPNTAKEETGKVYDLSDADV
ncbi:MAG: nucleotide exchange factor GrpE [Candidatus Obscuribacter phosphatis]|uniref:Protein GrpE n=1 Tax=Candidatus Obscuribacter phosphatis TaxID=1906157 RepID=A0A8J7PKC6_9BACT|nr:nucleotide exchange factor GrpE [Candidatus Obscuribacter phosphatis]